MKIIKLLFIVYFIILSNLTKAQFYDNNWITGIFVDTYKNGIVTFTNGSSNPIADSLNHHNLIYFTNSSVSDSAGNLAFYTNGINIFDSTHSIMQNGNGLSPCLWTNNWDSIGLSIIQGTLALPKPSDNNLYFLFHQSFDLYQTSSMNQHPAALYYSVVDMSQNSGLGSVIQKNDTLLYLSSGLISSGPTATKHANGRDWWLIHHKAQTNEFIIWLITPSIISSPVTQAIGLSPDYNILGSNNYGWQFSPDGTKLAFIAAGGTSNKRIDYFNFDRCTGLLSNPQNFTFQDSSTFSTGISFSSNSRFLYVCSDYFIYQYDTWSSNIALSRQIVAVYDGHIFYLIPSPFFMMQLAPDGKIYVSSDNFPDYFSVINNPDSLGSACDVTQHSFNTFTRNKSVPNNPNYRLGRLVGSSCDTLTHVSSIISFDPHITLLPNPNSGKFIIKYKLLEGYEGDLEIRDILGNVVYTQKLPIFSNVQNIELNNLSDGIYFCMLRSNNHSTALKFVKQ